MRVRLEWDQTKNLSNQSKHGVSFEEASQVFLDPMHVSIQDRIEAGEERWQTCGLVDGLLLLMVTHTIRESGVEEVIRIISARHASRSERRHYEEENS